MSIFLLPDEQFLTTMCQRSECLKKSNHFGYRKQRSIFGKNFEMEMRRANQNLTFVKTQKEDAYEYNILMGPIYDTFKALLSLKFNEKLQSLKMTLNLLGSSNSYFKVDNLKKCIQLGRDLRFNIEKSGARVMNPCISLINGRIIVHFAAFLICNKFLEENGSKGQSRLFKLYKNQLELYGVLLRNLLLRSCNGDPLNFNENQAKYKTLDNIYRFTYMININSNFTESFIETEQQITDNDRKRCLSIRKTLNNTVQLPSIIQQNGLILQKKKRTNFFQLKRQKDFDINHEQLYYLKSIIAMPIQQKSLNVQQPNAILNPIMIHNPETIQINKRNEGGFSQIFLAQITFNYVSSFQKRKLVNPKIKQQPLHRFVIVKKNNGTSKFNRIRHQIDIIRNIKDGLPIFINKYYCVLNQPQPFGEAVIMDFVPFKNLREYIDSSDASISLTTKLYLIFSIVQSLRYIKCYRIVHLDLNPINIMIFCNLLVKLLDFGESYHPQVCQENHLPGNTIPYSPPEVCSGKAGSFTSKSDVFSLGVLIYEILYGKRPYFIAKKGEHPSVSMRDYLSKWYFNPQEYQSWGNLHILRILNLIISKCLQPNPEDRPELDWIAIIVRQSFEFLN